MSYPLTPASFVDITTSTIPKTAVKRGDYNIAETEVALVSKASGVGTAIRRGYACTRNNAVTPNVFAVTTTKSGDSVVIAGLPLEPTFDKVNVTGAADGNGEDVSASDADIKFIGITDSNKVVGKASGAIQPGQQVMTAAAGCFAAYDGTGAQYIKGMYLGKPGGTSDGAYITQAAADGDLIVIDFEGGGI